MRTSGKARFDALKVAVSVLALIVGAGLGGPASAQSASDLAGPPESNEDIVANGAIPQSPGGTPQTGTSWSNTLLDPLGEVNGVGQMIGVYQTGVTTANIAGVPPGSGVLGLCTGTLINPRTVITAAHCVYTNPAHQYGSQTGTGPGILPPGPGIAGLFSGTGTPLTAQGIPLSFGFASTNRCIGPTPVIPAAGGVRAYPTGNGCTVGTGPYERWRDSGFRTQAAHYIYNANQVWYGTGAQPVALGGGGEFANQDIALVTLDTHAAGIPTWALLFSPLDGPTHATITGYGTAGVGTPPIGNRFAGIDYRRRSAENMIDALMTNNDWVDSPAINPGNTAFAAHQHAIYWNDFDDPNWNPTTPPANFFAPGAGGYYDFNGLGGATLPNEGSTAGGDSGGPLIVDQRWSRQVVAGVLTGNWSFNGGIGTYGQFNVYPPLFQFWEDIVQNNPYKYVNALAGNGSWTDASHWIQAMDPNYTVIGPNGELLTGVPDTHQGGADGAVDKFGTLCFYGTDCTTFDGPGAPTGNGTPIITPGGPGTINFVPNNVEPVNSANAALHVRARYYDVTLNAPGTTWLNSGVTIDRFTMDNGHASLDVRSGGSLSIWTDATIGSGLLNVDGTFNSGEMLVLQGIITGTGTINPTYLTSVAGAIAPGGANVGTLTIQGDVVLTSASQFFVEVGRDGADLLQVTADPAQGTLGDIMLGGDLRMVKASNGPAPRHGQTFTLILADGTVLDTFDRVFAQTGVLRPMMSYNPNSVEIELRAGRFADVLEGSPQELAFANALDQLRDGSYNLLYDLYGEMDVMDFAYLQGAFHSLTPVSLFNAQGLMAMQNSGFGDTVQDRLSLISRDAAPVGLSVLGAPGQVLSFGGDGGLGAASELSFASMLTQSTTVDGVLPRGMTAFVSGGYGDVNASAVTGEAYTGDDGIRSWNVAGGVEQRFGDHLTLGAAAAYSHGDAMESSAVAQNDLGQAAIYGAYRFDNGAYVTALLGAGASSTSTERQLAAGVLNYQMQGDVGGTLLLASVESGVNFEFGNGLVVTPNVSIRQMMLRMDPFTENGGEAALAFAEQTANRLEARIGARLAGDFLFDSGWRLTPALSAAVVANLSGDEDGVWTRFAAAPDVAFYVPGAVRDEYWGEVSGGLQLVRDATSFSLRMETSVARQEEHEDRVVARFAQQF